VGVRAGRQADRRERVRRRGVRVRRAGEGGDQRGAVQLPIRSSKRVLHVANGELFRRLRERGIAAGFKDLGAGGVACATKRAGGGPAGAAPTSCWTTSTGWKRAVPPRCCCARRPRSASAGCCRSGSRPEVLRPLQPRVRARVGAPRRRSAGDRSGARRAHVPGDVAGRDAGRVPGRGDHRGPAGCSAPRAAGSPRRRCGGCGRDRSPRRAARGLLGGWERLLARIPVPPLRLRGPRRAPGCGPGRATRR